MHWAMAHLQRQSGDEDAALFNEMESRRLAKEFLHELGRVGDWAVYKEDAEFMTKMLQGENPGLDVGLLATPRPVAAGLPRVVSTVSGKVAPAPAGRPTREWTKD